MHNGPNKTIGNCNIVQLTFTFILYLIFTIVLYTINITVTSVTTLELDKIYAGGIWFLAYALNLDFS